MELLTDIPSRLDAALTNDSGFTDPFRVFQFQPFSSDLYQAVLDHLPDYRFYRNMPHQDIRPDTRRVMALKDERINALPAKQSKFWREFVTSWNSPEVSAVFRRHLALDGIPLHPGPMLMRDMSGYRISPHQDKPSKVCTIQVYLPRDDSRPQLGTSFYRMVDGHLELAKTIEYRPNVAYAFKVTDNSWHGTIFGEFAGPPRDSLLLTYYRVPPQRY